MRALQLPASAVLGTGLVLGIVGDLLLRARGEPALNLFVWISCVAVAALLLHRLRGGSLSGEAKACLGVGVLFAAGLVWRGSPALRLMALAGAAVWFALPALRAGAAWIRNGGLVGYVGSLAAAAGHAAFGAPLTLAAVDWQGLSRLPAEQARWRHVAAVARGSVIALPLIILFGGLFISADAVFASLVTDIVRVDLDTLASHIVLTGFLAWVSVGYLRGSLTGAPLPVSGEPRPLLTVTELGTAVGLLGLLFLAFVIVQFRYLFGGTDLVHVTPGLTYAEYARRGFFELVAVVALMLPLLLAADSVIRRNHARDEIVFRVLAGAQIVLVFAVLASALQRMRLYQAVYGLTEQRFYVTAMLLMMGAVLLWFTATVLQGRRGSFAFGTLIIAAATAAVLHAVNPDAIIARVNLARAAAEDPGLQLDVAYATSLSADAVPVLIDALPSIRGDARGVIAQRLLKRWVPDERVPLRTWNWSEARARRVVQANADWLRPLAATAQSTAPPPAPPAVRPGAALPAAPAVRPGAALPPAPGAVTPPRTTGPASSRSGSAPPAVPDARAAAAHQDRARPSCCAAAAGTQSPATGPPAAPSPRPVPRPAVAAAAAPPASAPRSSPSRPRPAPAAPPA